MWACLVQSSTMAFRSHDGLGVIPTQLLHALRVVAILVDGCVRSLSGIGSVSRQLGGAPGRILLWDDQVSLSRREDAATMLLTPLIVYSTCADEEQWNRATRNGNAQIEGWTMQKCREVGDVPTTAMALISVFGSATSWREMHNLKARRWPLNDPDEVFCLKRERWVNETPGRAKSGEVGLEC